MTETRDAAEIGPRRHRADVRLERRRAAHVPKKEIGAKKKSVRKEIASLGLLPGAAPLNLVQPRRSNIGREESRKCLGSVWDVPLPRKCQGRV